MARFWKFLSDSRLPILILVGVAAVAALLVLGAVALDIGLVWSAIVGLALLGSWGIGWMIRRAWRAREGRRLASAIATEDADDDGASDGSKGDVAVLRKNLLDAVSTI